MKRNLGLLIAGTLLFWVLLMYPVRWLGVVEASLYSTVAVFLCLIPAVATLAWASWFPQRTPEQHLLLVVGGTAFRMVFVLGIGLWLYLAVPSFYQPSFWMWVSVFYLFTLALEIALVVSGWAEEKPRLQ